MSNERLVVKDPVCGMGVDPDRYVSAPGTNDLSNDPG